MNELDKTDVTWILNDSSVNFEDIEVKSSNNNKNSIYVNIDGVVKLKNESIPDQYIEYEDGTIMEIKLPSHIQYIGDTWYFEEGECYHYSYTSSNSNN